MYKFTSLRDQALILLQNRPASLSLKMISEEMNVSVRWLQLFRNGQIMNPGVCIIEHLIHFLSNYTPKA